MEKDNCAKLTITVLGPYFDKIGGTKSDGSGILVLSVADHLVEMEEEEIRYPNIYCTGTYQPYRTYPTLQNGFLFRTGW